MKIKFHKLYGKNNLLITAIQYNNDSETHGFYLDKAVIAGILANGFFNYRVDELVDITEMLARPGAKVIKEILPPAPLLGLPERQVDVLHVPVSTIDDVVDVLLWKDHQHGSLLRIQDPAKPGFTEIEPLMDMSETRALMAECFKPDFQDTVIVDETKNIIRFNGENPELVVTPLDNALQKSGSAAIARIQKVVHTKQVKLNHLWR